MKWNKEKSEASAEWMICFSHFIEEWVIAYAISQQIIHLLYFILFHPFVAFFPEVKCNGTKREGKIAKNKWDELHSAMNETTFN